MGLCSNIPTEVNKVSNMQHIEIISKNPLYPHIIQIMLNYKLSLDVNIKHDKVYVNTFGRMGSGKRCITNTDKAKQILNKVKELIK